METRNISQILEENIVNNISDKDQDMQATFPNEHEYKAKWMGTCTSSEILSVKKNKLQGLFVHYCVQCKGLTCTLLTGKKANFKGLENTTPTMRHSEKNNYMDTGKWSVVYLWTNNALKYKRMVWEDTIWHGNMDYGNITRPHP